MNYGKAIEICMLAAGMSMTDLARACDLHQSAISKYISYERYPTRTTIEAICEATKTPIGHFYILCLEDSDMILKGAKKVPHKEEVDQVVNQMTRYRQTFGDRREKWLQIMNKNRKE